MKYIVEVKNISKKFGKIIAVNDVSFSIKEGKFFSLLGPSGCGKTTILRIIGGFLEADNGEVIIDGKNMKGVPPNKRNTSMVFQNLALFPHMDVEENITYGLKKRKLSKYEINKKLKKILNIVNLEGFESRRINELSGGQQQRVALARSLIIEPKMLLLDEPLASLDKKLRISMRSELKDIQKRTGTTFLYVTHDQSEALTMSDNIGIMNEGVLLQTGSPVLIYNKPKNTFIADFIGAGNFIPIVEKSKNEKFLTLKTIYGGEIILKNYMSSKDYYNPKDKSASFTFFIRPEKIKITDKKIFKNNSFFNDNSYEGIVKSIVFEGPDIRVKVISQNIGNITIEIKNDRNLKNIRENSNIYFYWDRSDGILLEK